MVLIINLYVYRVYRIIIADYKSHCFLKYYKYLGIKYNQKFMNALKFKVVSLMLVMNYKLVEAWKNFTLPCCIIRLNCI